MDGSEISERDALEVSAQEKEVIQPEKTGDFSLRTVLKTIFLPIGSVAGFLIATFPISLPAIYGLAVLLLYYLR